jgi:hypothetical protein
MTSCYRQRKLLIQNHLRHVNRNKTVELCYRLIRPEPEQRSSLHRYVSAGNTYEDNSLEYRRFLAGSGRGIGVEPYLRIREIKVWEPLSVALTPLVPSADFDSDNDVDGTDFLTWGRGHGITSGVTHAMGDANCDGVIGWGDLETWQSQFGSPAPLSAAGSIPEPTTSGLALAVLCLAVGRRYI